LANLRKFIDLHPEIQQLVGTIARYKIVLDANIAVADLAHKYKNPHIRRTAIEEAIQSSAMVLHAPFWLDEEMIRSAIPQFAARGAIPELELQALWIEYKKQIIWTDVPVVPESIEAIGGDPKDIPYVALQRTISAQAILSRDKDIDALGGNRVDLEFVLSLRSYARAASYSVGIRVGGVVVAIVSLELLAQLMKMIGSTISELPPAIKVALVAGVVFVAAHPQSRGRVVELLRGLGKSLAGTWPAIEVLVEMASRKQMEAQSALGDTERLLNPQGPLSRSPNENKRKRKRRLPVGRPG
jgi:predicted nucleic acid-binding protein